MYTEVEKSKKNRSMAVANSVAKQMVVYEDNRPEGKIRKALQLMMRRSEKISTPSLLKRKCERCAEVEDEDFTQKKVIQRAAYASLASCESIKEAYPILGTKAQKQYDKIEHAPGNDKKRVKTYLARVNVMELFRQAHLCNGMNGAPTSVQNAFLAGEEGHITAANNVRASITNDKIKEKLPEDCADQVKSVSIRKQQCK